MTSGDSNTIQNHAAFIWSVADLLRGDYKQSEYGKVILPLTVLRRLDCVLEPTKQAVLDRAAQLAGRNHNLDPILQKEAGEQFYNTSRFDFATLVAAPDDLADNLKHYVASFSASARDVLDKFDFTTQIDRLDRSKLLYLVMSKFAEVDLHPDKVSNLEMGYLYEELIRKFSELSNETAGEHFTPREVIRLMVDLLFIEDDQKLTKPGAIKTIYDGACGTGGMLSVAEDRLRELNPAASLQVYGQELNAETYAICRSDMMLKGQDATNIAYGNSFSEDGHPGLKVDYSIQNPPFGVEWKKVADAVKDEHNNRGLAGRFGAGLPRINDGSFLFLQNAISKMKPVADGGSRVAIVFNGSPLFTGAAGSGESEIRRWIIENDWLEAVVALPDQLFYNTGISTYFWIVTNRKAPERRGKVQLVDARNCFVKMRKSLGEKRKQVSDAQIADIVRAYGQFTEVDGDAAADNGADAGAANGGPKPSVKIFPNEAFGFLRITVERPLRLRWEVTDEGVETLRADKRFAKLTDDTQNSIIADLGHSIGTHATDKALRDLARTALKRADIKGKPIENAIVDAFAIRDPDADPVTDNKGNVLPDPDLRDNENVPLPTKSVTYEADVDARLGTIEYRSAIDDYMTAEVHPYVPDAWVDHDKTKIGYEIPLTRHFYTYTPPRPLDEIDAEIKQLEAEIQDLLAEVTE
ncbi:MAG: SAM-dependent DNA methyltransferase [Candidatus Microthrix sp.]|nr:class I SAM-dependent DNA methyltransferase [Candidatus Microthrix sp.]MBK7018330.1 SAM-dependent DNA methyltransferase [Candidatus Microthrix sp.]